MRSVRAGFPPPPASDDLFASPAALAVLAVVALLLPVRSFQQALFAACFALALIAFTIWGRLFGQAVLRISLAPCTAVYLGQFVVLALASPLLALNGVAAAASGHSLPLYAMVAPATLAVAFLRRRDPRPPPRLDLLALLGLGSAALVVAIYSRHLSALGLDVHEHIAWVHQIVTRGFVPLAEPGTAIVGDYPRGFHLLGALWNAAGLAPAEGPFVKAMPFLQTALPALAIAEQMIDARGPEAPGRWKGEVALGLAFYAYAFLLVPAVYHGPDLLGTPRYSSGGLLLLPIALVMIARVRRAPRAATAAIAVLPLVAAWALIWNPIVVVLVAVVTLPVLAAFWVALRPARVREAFRGTALAAFLACGASGILALVQDPWVVSFTADRVPAAATLLQRTGLVTFDQAVARDLATAREKPVHPAVAKPPCSDARCIRGVLARAGVAALELPLASLRSAAAHVKSLALHPSLPELRNAFRDALLYRPALLADYAAFPFAIWVTAAALVAVWRAARGRGAAPSPEGRMLAAAIIGAGLGAVGLAFVAQVAAALNDGTHPSILLAGYLQGAGGPVSGAFFWLPFSAATMVLAAPLLERAADPSAPPRRRIGQGVAAMGLLLWLALPLAARLNLHRPLQHNGFYDPVGLRDLRAFRAIEAAIPETEAVLVPAEHRNIAEWEHWVLPLGQTAALLPYGDRRYLFDVYLGGTYPLSWRDLEDRLCSRDPAVRREFLRRTSARWALAARYGCAGCRGGPARAVHLRDVAGSVRSEAPRPASGARHLPLRAGALTTALRLQLRDALLQFLHLLRLGLVGVAIVPRLRLLLPERPIAVAASDGAEEREQHELHWTRLSRSSISGGPRKPVTRVGPSPGTAHSGGRSSLQAIISTVGSPGTLYFEVSWLIASVSSVASIFRATKRSETSFATTGSVQVCTSSSLQAAHHSAEKSISSGLPVARDCCTAICSSLSQGIWNALSLRGAPAHPKRSPTPARSRTRAQALSAFSRAAPWNERLSAPARTPAKASMPAMRPIVLVASGSGPGRGTNGSTSATAAATSATPRTLFTVSIQAPDRGSRSDVAPRTKKSTPMPTAYVKSIQNPSTALRCVAT